MDLSFVADQLGNFADFASGIKNLFKGFAGAFDTIAGVIKQGEAYDPSVDTSGFEGLSSASE